MWRMNVLLVSLKFSNIKTKEKKCLTFDDIGTLVFDNRKCYLSERVIEYCILNHIGIFSVTEATLL